MKNSTLAILGVLLGLIIALATNFYLSQRENIVTLPARADSLDLVSIETESTSSQISSDGTKKLTMKSRISGESIKTYSFLVEDIESGIEQNVFTQIVKNKAMSIPYNAWSPDNKYFFIQEKGQGERNTLVLNALGEKFVQGQQYLNASQAFKNVGTQYNFEESTGWASESLLLINTLNEDGSKGPSYWFEVPSQAIIQLGTQF